MSNANDKKILDLKKQIETKKSKIAKAGRFSPVTSCMLHLNGQSTNLHVQDKTGLTSLLVSVNALRLSAIDLGVESEYVLSGYNVNDWITDIKARLAILSVKEEEKKLQVLEDKLHVMLSSDKKVELEIENIEKMLK